MKLECNKEVLDKAIQKTTRLAGKHLTLPVLSCVFIEAFEDGRVLLKSTNLDLGLELEIKAKVFEVGNVAVPANIFYGVLSSVKDDVLILEKKDNNLKIETKSNSALIKCMQSEDFPSIPKLEKINPIKINYQDLMLGFKSVWYSASNSSIKPELGSVYIYKGDNGLVFVSTDSFRLAEKTINTKVSDDFPTTLIPYKNVAEIMKIFEDGNEDIEIIFEKNQAAFIRKNVYLVSRLIDGNFPDYKQIVPKSYVSSATILKNDLINAIKTSNIFSDNLNQTKIKVINKEKILDIESKNNDVGEYRESIKASISGDDIELNFNNRYITECMQSIPSESITLSFGGIGKPLMITGSSDKSFVYIVMPMNR